MAMAIKIHVKTKPCIKAIIPVGGFPSLFLTYLIMGELHWSNFLFVAKTVVFLSK